MTMYAVLKSYGKDKWVNKWDGKMPTVTNGGNTVLYGIGNE